MGLQEEGTRGGREDVPQNGAGRQKAQGEAILSGRQVPGIQNLMSLKCHRAKRAREEPSLREGPSLARCSVRLHPLRLLGASTPELRQMRGSWPCAARGSFQLHRETQPWPTWRRVCHPLPGDTGLHAGLGVRARPADRSQTLPAAPASTPHALPSSGAPFPAGRALLVAGDSCVPCRVPLRGWARAEGLRWSNV